MRLYSDIYELIGGIVGYRVQSSTGTTRKNTRIVLMESVLSRCHTQGLTNVSHWWKLGLRVFFSPSANSALDGETVTFSSCASPSCEVRFIQTCSSILRLV